MPAHSSVRSIKLGWLRHTAVWLGYASMRAVVLLPYAWQLALGKRFGDLARRLLHARRRIAARNLEVCFPELTRDERHALLAEHFRALGASIVEMAMGWFGPERTIHRLVRIDGEQHLRAAFGAGKGVILYSAHFTTFEFFFPVLASLCPRLCGMYKLQRNAVMNRIMTRGRSRSFDCLFTNVDVRDMLKNLAANAAVWYASDQSYGRKGSALIPFFGEPAMTNTAISRIARVSGAAVLPYFCRRLPDDAGYVMTIGAPLDGLPSADAEQDTRRLMQLIEDYIRLCPEQYWWIHRRFKGRPESHPDLYSAASE
jgi:KDO2-lipid IV(A) lauroyltransferase